MAAGGTHRLRCHPPQNTSPTSQLASNIKIKADGKKVTWPDMDVCEGGADKLEGGEKRDIRRPMNAFLIFCKRHRSMVREKHPERDNRSVTRILGDLWANLAMEEKVIYTNLAKQYKDAFMKANPDYKWHSSEKLPQPGKMSTRPTNTRVLGSSSGVEGPPQGAIVSGQLADPDKMGGLSLLLMAGQHSMAGRERSSPASVLERRMTSPDLSTSNSALLQLAEMCSTELHGKHADTSILRSAPPKKRARHWSYSDCGHTDLPEQKSPFLLRGESLSATVLEVPSKKHGLEIACSENTPVKASTCKASLVLGSNCDDATCPSCDSGMSACLQEQIDGQQKPMHPLSPPKAGGVREGLTYRGVREGLTCQGVGNQSECDEERDIRQVRPGQQSAGTSACLFPNHDQSVARALADIGMPPKKKFTKLQVSQQKEKLNWQGPGLGLTLTQGLQYKESWKRQETLSNTHLDWEEAPQNPNFDWQEAQEKVKWPETESKKRFGISETQTRRELGLPVKYRKGKLENLETQSVGKSVKLEIPTRGTFDKSESQSKWPKTEPKEIFDFHQADHEEKLTCSELLQRGKGDWPGTQQEDDSLTVLRAKSTLKQEKMSSEVLLETDREEKCKLSSCTSCVSDQNDNAILTCGKLVVDHIIDRLFSANMSNGCHKEPHTVSSQNIENAREMKAEEMCESSTSGGHDVGLLLSEESHTPQRLVEKVMKEAYSLDLKNMTTASVSNATVTRISSQDDTVCSRQTVVDSLQNQEAGVSCHASQETVVAICETSHERAPTVCQTSQETAPLVFHDTTAAVSHANLEEAAVFCHKDQERAPTACHTSQETAPDVCCASQETVPVLHDDQKMCQVSFKVSLQKEMGHESSFIVKESNAVPSLKDEVHADVIHDEDTDTSTQPVRKSRRRNRGQRYQELIKEGIIQPSKERLAARRMEMSSASSGASTKPDDMIDDRGYPPGSVLRPALETECTFPDSQRYRTGDFDLEAEIATLPPCSLDQVSRRRLIRRCSESESSKRPACPSSPEKDEIACVPLTSSSFRVQPHPQPTKSEPLIGSQKRKARKRSISRLLPVSCDSSGTAFSHSLSTQIPLVRDATTAPCETERALVAMVTSRSQSVLTASLKDSSVKILRQASDSELMPQKSVVCQDSDKKSLYLGGANDQKTWYMETSESRASESSGGRLKQGRKAESINENKKNPDDWPERGDGWVNNVRTKEGKQDGGDDQVLAKSTQQEVEGLGMLAENTQQEQEAEGKMAAKFRFRATVCGLNEDMDSVQCASLLQMCASPHSDLDESTDNSVCDHLKGASKSLQKSETSAESDVCGFEREGLTWRPQPVSAGLEPQSSGGQHFSHITESRDSLDCTADGFSVKYQSDISGSNQVKLSWHKRNLDSLELVRNVDSLELVRKDFSDERSIGGSELVLPLSGTGSAGITAAKVNVVGKLDFCNQSADCERTHMGITERGSTTSANEKSYKLGGRWTTAARGKSSSKDDTFRDGTVSRIDSNTKDDTVSRIDSNIKNDTARDGTASRIDSGSSRCSMQVQHDLMASQIALMPSGLPVTSTDHSTEWFASSSRESYCGGCVAVQVSTTLTSPSVPSHFHAGSLSSVPCNVAVEISPLPPSSGTMTSPLTTAVLSRTAAELCVIKDEVVADTPLAAPLLCQSPLPGSPSVAVVHS